MAVPQVSLYFDQAVLEAATARAKELGLPLSRFVSATLRRELADEWPAGFADLFGAVPAPSFGAPPEMDWDDDAPRDQL